ncbi:hypothetical protein JIG36_38010 [Actinoplanes sp. LDG1-06]|uniref:Uncharacterized protein n=1 Tax=Paractinoplanes ovalisporus TaxID=2810368 RepID=A0ABS2AN73_9ACTN|nr:hypothetical protein [Actinoplanes ovalisporus]MBM2621314.1 hypothetical protein [Actinoplanes ovalisporus]
MALSLFALELFPLPFSLDLTQAQRVTLGQPPRSVPRMLAAKLLTLRGVVAALGPVAHLGELGSVEQLHLAHAQLSRAQAKEWQFDHAKIDPPIFLRRSGNASDLQIITASQNRWQSATRRADGVAVTATTTPRAWQAAQPGTDREGRQ